METLKPLTKDKAAGHLVTLGLRIARLNYGGENVRGETYLPYHNEIHTSDVIAAVTDMGNLALERGKIVPEELLLLRIAASFHDTEQLQGAGINEDISADNAETMMRATGQFSKAEVERVRSLISATKIKVLDGTLIQEPGQDYLKQIICDADLALLGEEPKTYWRRSTDLFRELKRVEGKTEEGLRGFLQWQELLLAEHTFFTPEGAELFPNQGINLRDTRRMLNNHNNFSRYFSGIK